MKHAELIIKDHDGTFLGRIATEGDEHIRILESCSDYFRDAVENLICNEHSVSYWDGDTLVHRSLDCPSLEKLAIIGDYLRFTVGVISSMSSRRELSSSLPRQLTFTEARVYQRHAERVNEYYKSLCHGTNSAAKALGTFLNAEESSLQTGTDQHDYEPTELTQAA